MRRGLGSQGERVAGGDVSAVLARATLDPGTRLRVWCPAPLQVTDPSRGINHDTLWEKWRISGWRARNCRAKWAVRSRACGDKSGGWWRISAAVSVVRVGEAR